MNASGRMIRPRYRALVLTAAVVTAWLVSSLLPPAVPIATALVVVLGYCLFGIVEASVWKAHRRGMSRLARAGAR